MRSGTERDGASLGHEIDLSTLGASLGRNKVWFIVPALVCCVLMSVFVTLVKPRYTSEAKVLIENGESFFTRPDKSELQPTQLPDDEAIQSQVQLISSRDIARAAIGKLGLSGNPEFDPMAGSQGVIGRLGVLFGLDRDPSSVSPEDRILASYYDRLQVFPVNKSRVITIEFTSNDPELAARAANVIAGLYLEAQSAAKRESARAAAESLASLIANLRNRAAEAEVKADAFRSSSGLLIGTNNTTITAQQLADLTTQLAQARTSQADAQAKARILRDMIRVGRIGEIPDVANNELIRRISEQRINLRAAIAQQGRTLLPGHPHMQELNAQLQGIEEQLHGAAENAVRTLENDARIAASRVDNLSAALDQQKKTASTAGVDQVQLNTLELQARLLKDQLEFNTAKYQEAVARENAVATPADARLISRAVPPQLPTFPKKLPLIAIGTLAGLILSVGILIARELLSGRPFEREEPENIIPQQLGMRPAFDDMPVPLAASVTPAATAPPAVEAASGIEAAEPVRVAEPPAAAPEASQAEDDLVAALRSIRRPRRDGQATRVLVTSAEATLDTSRAAVSFARLLASEARAIIVDFDRAAPAMRSLSLASITPEHDSREPAGLAELLAGEATFAEIIHRDGGSRLHVVPFGQGELPLDSRSGISLVLDALAETYDYVVMQACVPAGPITQALASEADVILLSIGAGTSQKTADAARADLARRVSAPMFEVSTAVLLSKTLARDAA